MNFQAIPSTVAYAPSNIRLFMLVFVRTNVLRSTPALSLTPIAVCTTASSAASAVLKHPILVLPATQSSLLSLFELAFRSFIMLLSAVLLGVAHQQLRS